ncbi:MAG: ARMT1-like domain-containing protein [Lachnospiraceae bacterium]|nr:ARMT1-like domain-containing protein [Lachnospiraceae bacterium]
MRIPDSCAKCLYDRQLNKTDNAEYLAEIKALIDNRREDDTSPYLVYQFNRVHERYFGKGADYTDIKKQYNDLVLKMEEGLRQEIERSEDPLAKALVMARIGNYIDFGAMNHVDKDEFISLFGDTGMSERDEETYESFLKECEMGKVFLLICDNCGEIVIDRLMLEELKKRFPHLRIKAMVRGKPVLNDATLDDAEYSGLSKVAEIIPNGEAVAGTVYGLLSGEARKALDEADVILAKGQGNYESLSGQGRHIFFALLCKCELFMNRFSLPRLAGIFTEERPDIS